MSKFNVSDITCDNVVIRYEFEFNHRGKEYHGILTFNEDEQSEYLEFFDGEESVDLEIMNGVERQELIDEVLL